MTELERALRTTSDALLADLEQLQALEEAKRRIDPADPELPRLSTKVADLAERVLRDSDRERRLATVATERALAGDPSAPSRAIDETPRDLHMILGDWRDAERRLSEAPQGSEAALIAEAEARSLRDEYQRARTTLERLHGEER